MRTSLNIQEQEITEILKSVIDPELMVNIIDLGLVYDVRISESENYIEVDMTLTSKGCPLGDAIMEEVHQQLSTHFPGFKTNVNLIWEPAWTTEMLTSEGKNALGQ